MALNLLFCYNMGLGVGLFVVFDYFLVSIRHIHSCFSIYQLMINFVKTIEQKKL